MSTFAQSETSGPWHIRHVELEEEIPSVSTKSNRHGCYVVFWWKGLPLGDQWIPSGQLPVSAQQLKERALRTITPTVQDHLRDQKPSGSHGRAAPARPLEQLHGQVSVPETDAFLPSVSVVVCTRDRPEQLKTCLRSLQQLSRPPEEILVVDNAPKTEATRQIVENTPGVRYVLEPRSGLGVARNAGISRSTGDIIAFTDDDVTVHPDWILRLQDAFQDPEILAVTGLVLPTELETRSQRIFEAYWSFNRGYEPRMFDSRFFERTRPYGAPVWRIGAGANMAFRRQAFDLLGGFDERLGAGASGCSEDSEMWYRVLAEGGRCRYEPTAVVYHRHRRTLRGLRHQVYHYMRGHVVALLIQFEKHRHWGNLFRLFGVLPLHYTISFLGHLLQKNGLDGILSAQVRGCIAGIKYYLPRRQESKAS